MALASRQVAPQREDRCFVLLKHSQRSIQSMTYSRSKATPPSNSVTVAIHRRTFATTVESPGYVASSCLASVTQKPNQGFLTCSDYFLMSRLWSRSTIFSQRHLSRPFLTALPTIGTGWSFQNFASRAQRQATGTYAVEAQITPEAAIYWRNVMSAVDRPHLGSLVGSLEWSHPLGLSKRRSKGNVQCYDEFLKAKKRHPMAVVLVRIGDFYEAVGYDALVLCQYGGLNPMSPAAGIPMAGFPKAASSLRRHLNRLIEANFTVAIVEEVRSIVKAGAFLPSKERALVSIVNASSPYFLYGDVEDEYEGDDTPLPKPIMGVSRPTSSGGYRLLRYCPQRRAVLVTSQLSGEALVAHLHATGLAQPLHLHASVREEGLGGKTSTLGRVLPALLGTAVAEYESVSQPPSYSSSTAPQLGCSGVSYSGISGSSSVMRGRGGGGSTRGLCGGDVEGFKHVVVRQLGLDRKAAAQMEVIVPPYQGTTPIPPSLSTVTQLGLAGARGVPSLLAAALPDATPAPARDWLRRLLLLPPPPAVAEDIRTVCAVLAAGGDGGGGGGVLALPPLVTGVPGPRVVALLSEGAAGHNTLRELRAMLARVNQLLSLPGPAAAVLHCALGGVLQWSLNTHAGLNVGQLPAAVLAERCTAAAAVIDAVVPSSDETSSLADQEFLEEGAEEVGEGEVVEAAGAGDLVGERSEGSSDELGDSSPPEEEPIAAPAVSSSSSSSSWSPPPPTTTRFGRTYGYGYGYGGAAVGGGGQDGGAGPSLPPELESYLRQRSEGGDGGGGSGQRGGGGGVLQRRALSEAGRLIRRLEVYRGQVRMERLGPVVDQVTSTRTAVLDALLELAGALEVGAAGRAVVEFKLAPHDDAVWVRLLGPSGKKMAAPQQRAVVEAVQTATGLSIVNPLNRKRGTEGERYSSARLEAAAAAYRAAAEEASRQARRVLQELCFTLYGNSGSVGGSSTTTTSSSGGGDGHLMTLLAATEVSVAFTALERHVARTKAAGWNWPTMPLSTCLRADSRPAPRRSRTKQGGVAMGTTAAEEGGGGDGGDVRDVRLRLPGLVPYWMDRREAVANDVELVAGRLALLTGPNMAGKSTVLRSVAAAALLSSCGLSIPACGTAHTSGNTATSTSPSFNPSLSSSTPPPSPSLSSSNDSRPSTAAASSSLLHGLDDTAFPATATFPSMKVGGGGGSCAPALSGHDAPLFVSWLAHVSLRNFSGDSPLEGKSAFAVEMEDTAHTLAVARSAPGRVLVLLDELGKGTEVVAGSALAAAVVGALGAARAGGIFATHLHDLAYLLRGELEEGLLEAWAMEVVGGEEEGPVVAGHGGLPLSQEAPPPPPPPSALRPTRRILRNQVCLRSMALQVAAECGLQGDVLAAAAEHEVRLRAMMARAREGEFGGGSSRGGCGYLEGSNGDVKGSNGHLMAAESAGVAAPAATAVRDLAGGSDGDGGWDRGWTGGRGEGNGHGAVVVGREERGKQEAVEAGCVAVQVGREGAEECRDAESRVTTQAMVRASAVVVEAEEEEKEEVGGRQQLATAGGVVQLSNAARNSVGDAVTSKHGGSWPGGDARGPLDRTAVEDGANAAAGLQSAPSVPKTCSSTGGSAVAAVAVADMETVAAARAGGEGAAGGGDGHDDVALSPGEGLAVRPPAADVGASASGHADEAPQQRRSIGDMSPDEAHGAASSLLRQLVQQAVERSGCQIPREEAGALTWIEPEWVPTPAHAGEAVVYILRWWTGELYVGESEDIRKRLKQHRAAETRERRVAGQQRLAGSKMKRNETTLRAVYCLLPRAAGGKSAALDVESALISALQRQGFPLRSDHDKKRDVLHKPLLA